MRMHPQSTANASFALLPWHTPALWRVVWRIHALCVGVLPGIGQVAEPSLTAAVHHTARPCTLAFAPAPSAAHKICKCQEGHASHQRRQAARIPGSQNCSCPRCRRRLPVHARRSCRPCSLACLLQGPYVACSAQCDAALAAQRRSQPTGAHRNLQDTAAPVAVQTFQTLRKVILTSIELLGDASGEDLPWRGGK